MDLSIKKDPDAYFIKAMTLNYMGQFDKEIESFNKAIELDSSNSNYFSGLGDSFLNQEKFDKALSMYITATEKMNLQKRSFTLIPQLYAELNQPEKALEAFYKSKSTISKESDSYINALQLLMILKTSLMKYLIKNAWQSSGWLCHQMTEYTPHTTVHTGLVYGGSQSIFPIALYTNRNYSILF